MHSVDSPSIEEAKQRLTEWHMHVAPRGLWRQELLSVPSTDTTHVAA